MSLPASLLATLSPLEASVAATANTGQTPLAVATSLGLTLQELIDTWTAVQTKCETWIKSDIQNMLLFVAYKLSPDGTPVLRTRAERIAALDESITKSGRNGITAEQLDAMFFDAAPISTAN